MSSVTCNAAITTLDDLDDGEGGDIEEIARESDPPLLNFILPTTPWGGQGQVLLRAKPRESGSDSQRLVSQLDEWLANRDPGPADVVLLRCRRGIECNTCSVQASERCDPQGSQFCRACLDHEPIYCAFGSPCSKWNDYKTQEFVRRQRFYLVVPQPSKQLSLSESCRGPQPSPVGEETTNPLLAWVKGFGKPKSSMSLPLSSAPGRHEDRQSRTLTESVFPSRQQECTSQVRPYMRPFPANQLSHTPRTELQDPGSYESFTRVLPDRREQSTKVSVHSTQQAPRRETTVRFEDDSVNQITQGLKKVQIQPKSTRRHQSEENATVAEEVMQLVTGETSMKTTQMGSLLTHLHKQETEQASPEQGDGDGYSSNSDDDRETRRRRKHDGGRDRHGRGGGGGGGGGDRDGGGGDGGDNGNNGGRQDKERRRRHYRYEPDVSIPLGLIVDRLQGLEGRTRGNKTKQKPISLPSPVRESSGQITTISFYKWVHLLSRMVDDLSLEHAEVLLTLATDPKILPPYMREICYDSEDLAQALRRLKTRFPPLSSTWPLLVCDLTGKEPTSGTHQEVVDRCSEHLSSISALQSLHPRRDLNREETLAALASLGSTTELQSGVINAVRQFDNAKSLHPDDPDYSSYVSSLRSYLEIERETRQDILASVSLGRRMNPSYSGSPNVPAFASQPRTIDQAKNKKQKKTPTGQKGAGEKQKQNGQRDKNVSQKKDCSLCGSGKHPPFKCGKIQEIQAKKMDKPENLCERCCHWSKQGDPHQGACHIKSYLDKNGITKKMNLLCSIHQSTHYALCGACAPGQTTSGPKTSTPVVPGFMVSCLQQTNSLASDPTKIPQVAFMREVLTIKGKDGNTARVIAHYDSLSGANFSSEIPENFNWGEKGATSETFSLSTMIGREEYSLPVISLRIQGRGKRCLEADFLVNNYPEIEDTFSMPDLLKECGVSSMSQEERQIPLRIMFGVPCSTLFPQPQPIPKKMQQEFPFLSLHQSLITGAQLISGRVSPATPAKAIHSFMGMTTPGVSGEPSVHQTSVHQTDSKEEEKRESLPSQD